jgi:hypothetical protein
MPRPSSEQRRLSKINVYVNAVDDLLRRPEHGDGTIIGIPARR